LAIDSDRGDRASLAALGLGRLLAQQGDAAGATTAYQSAIESGHHRAHAVSDDLSVALQGSERTVAAQTDPNGKRSFWGPIPYALRVGPGLASSPAVQTWPHLPAGYGSVGATDIK
jgi:hypothetical protein